MSTTTATLNVNATQAIQTLNKVQKQVEGVGKSFDGLRSTLNKIAFGAFITNALRYADAIKDVSDATDVAIQNVTSFGEAVRSNGGSTENANAALLNFTRTLEEARTTSKSARDAFLQLGFSEEELAKTDTTAAFNKTIDALGRLTDKNKQAVLSNELVGKSLKGINITGTAQAYEQGISANIKYVEAIRSGSDAYGNLENNLGNLTKALLQVIKPLNDIVKSLNITAEAFEFLIKTLIAAGAAFALFSTVVRAGTFVKGAQEALTFGKALGAIGDKIVDVAKNLGGGAIIGALAKLGKFLYSATLQPLVQIVKMWGRVVTGAASAASVMGALGGTIALIVKGLLRLSLVITVLTALYQAFKFLNEAVFKSETVKKYTTEIDILIDKFQEFVGLKERFDASKPLVIQSGEVGVAPEGFGPGYFLKKREEQSKKLIDLYNNEKKSITNVTDAYTKQTAALLENLNYEELSLTASEEFVNQQKILGDLYKQNQDAIDGLIQRKESLSEIEQRAGLGTLIDQQIQQLRELYPLEKAAVEQKLAGIQKIKLEQDALIKQNELLKMQLTDDANIKVLQDQVALLQLYGDELENANIALQVTQTLEQTLLELRKQEIDLIARKGQLSQQQFAQEMAQIEALKQAAYERAGAEIDARTMIAQASRAAENDPALQVKKYMDELEKSATPAKRALDGVTSVFNNMDQALSTFVNTGKFKFKDFAAGIIKDLLMIQARAAAVSIFKSIISGLGFLAEGGPAQAGKPYIVGEKGPELFVPKSSGNVVPNDQLTSRGTATGQVNAPVTNNYITNNISAIDAKGVAQLFAENRKTLLGSVKMAEREMPYMAR